MPDPENVHSDGESVEEEISDVHHHDESNKPPVPRPRKTISVPSIRIPSATTENSFATRHRNHSSSEDSGEENVGEAWSSPPNSGRHKKKGGVDMTPPEVLLEKARKQARSLTKNGNIDGVLHERIRCIALARIVYGDDHWQLAKAHSKLAEAYLELKSLAPQAIKHSENSQDILLRMQENGAASGSSYQASDVLPVMELMYVVMGQSHGRMKRYQKAENFLKKADVVSKQRMDLHQTDASYMRLKVLNTLGKVQVKLNKFGNALECYEKALELAESCYGDESEELVPIYQDIGRAEQGQGELANHNRALDMFKKAREITLKKYNEGSTEVADATLQLAVAYENTGNENNEDHAKDYLEYCIGIYEQNSGEYSTKTLSARDELCRLLLRQGKHDESVILLKTIMKGKLHNHGDPSDQLADAHRLMGSIKLSQGNLELALKHLRKSHDMLRCVLGNNHKKTKLIAETIEMIKSRQEHPNF